MNLKTLAVLAGLVSASVGDTVHGVLVFTRHGDRKLPSQRNNPLLGKLMEDAIQERQSTTAPRP